MIRKALIIFGLVVTSFVVAVVIQQSLFYRPSARFEGKLADILPLNAQGWQGVDKPIAATPEQERSVDSILRYTDALVREYRHGLYTLEVYIAYWAPKTMPVRLVQAHTPDICWVRNGWAVGSAENAVPLMVADQRLKLAEYRRMVVPKNAEQETHVYYWHVVGDTIYTTQAVGEWDRWDPLKSLFRFGLNQKTEQFFIRVSSNTPFETLWQEPGVVEIMASLADLALARSVEAPVLAATMVMPE